MSLSLFGHTAIAAVLISSLVSCKTLQPVSLPDEVAIRPVSNAMWKQVDGVRSGNWFHVLNDGDEALEWRLRSIASATKSLDVQTFLWLEDRVGLQLFRAVLEAADRGVIVRLLVDDTFTIDEDDLIYDLHQHPNISFRIYNPFSRRYNGMVARQLMNLGEFNRLDHRMHNKVMLVDNQVAIVGGRNLADEYFGHHSEGNFRDMELLCSGPVVEQLSECFDGYWNCDWSFPADYVLKKPPVEQGFGPMVEFLKKNGRAGLAENRSAMTGQWVRVASQASGGSVTLIYDQPAERDPADVNEQPDQLEHALMPWIDGAKKELVLVSAYLIPTKQLEDALKRAIDRGVKVRILTNSLRSNNHLAAHGAYRRHMHHLVRGGADLHEVRADAKDRGYYMQAPISSKELGLHAKFILIDQDLSFVGSANLDPRSLHLNTEIGLMVRSRDLNQRLRKVLDLDFRERNAWRLVAGAGDKVRWVAEGLALESQPADSFFQRLEDWFVGHLPIESKM